MIFATLNVFTRHITINYLGKWKQRLFSQVPRRCRISLGKEGWLGGLVGKSPT